MNGEVKRVIERRRCDPASKITQADKAWFADNPGRRFRGRAPYLGEIESMCRPGEVPVLPTGQEGDALGTWAVIIEWPAPGQSLSKTVTVWLEPEYINTVNDDAMLEALAVAARVGKPITPEQLCNLADQLRRGGHALA